MSPQAFQETYLPLTSRIYSIAMAILGNTEDAEDAVQDTFLRLWERADRLDGVERAEAFLCTTVRNVCLNKIRARRHETDVDEMPDLADPSDRTGQDRLTAADDRSFLGRLLGRLSPKARRVVTLRHVGEYATKEIATLTGDTDVNVRATLSRARRQLKEEYLRAMREAQ